MAAPDLLISGLNAVVTSDYGHPGAKFKSRHLCSCNQRDFLSCLLQLAINNEVGSNGEGFEAVGDI